MFFKPSLIEEINTPYDHNSRFRNKEHSNLCMDVSGCFVFFRGIQHQTVQELEKQVELLRERDGQLQYTVKEQETKIEALKQKLKNTGDKVGYITVALTHALPAPEYVSFDSLHSSMVSLTLSTGICQNVIWVFSDFLKNFCTQLSSVGVFQSAQGY